MATEQTNMRELIRQSKTQTVSQMGGGSVQQFFEGNRQAIEQSLPKHMNADRMMKVATHALRTTPALRECNVASLMGAIIQCSQLGLEPNTVLGHAYLVPFKNGKTKQKDVQLITGYKGLIDLARRSGQVQTFYAHEVCENDDFDVRLGTDAGIDHKPSLGERGEVIGFYAVAHMKDGGHQFEWMSAHEVNAIRDASQGYRNALRYGKTDNPWMTHYVQMGRKTVIRRLANYLPLSIEFATATTLDGMAEAGQPQDMGNVITGDFTVQPNDAPPNDGNGEDGETGSADPSEPDNSGGDQGGGAEAASTGDEVSEPDKLVLRIRAAKTQDELDEIADLARELSGQDKAKVTKAYNSAVERLNQDSQTNGESGAQGAFGSV